MNARAIIPLVAGLAIAGLAAKLGFDHLAKARGATVQTVTLWAPVEAIPRGTAITEEMIKPLPFPRELVPSGAIISREKLVGRVPATIVPKNVPILESMLHPPGTPPGLFVPPGYRAVAVKIDESSGVDNHLQPGVFVDVVGLFTVRKNGRSETIARTVIENVEVAAVGDRLSPEAPGRTSGSGKSGRVKPARAVTLLVKPNQVPILHLAEQRGKIKLSMRGSVGGPDLAQRGDDTVEQDQLLGLDSSPSQKNKPAKESFVDRLARLFASFNQQSQRPFVAAPKQQTGYNLTDLAWTMVVYNGDERTVLGFPKNNPYQPIRLGGPKQKQGSGEPNVFNLGDLATLEAVGSAGNDDDSSPQREDDQADDSSDRLFEPPDDES